MTSGEKVDVVAALLKLYRHLALQGADNESRLPAVLAAIKPLPTEFFNELKNRFMDVLIDANALDLTREPNYQCMPVELVESSNVTDLPGWWRGYLGTVVSSRVNPHKNDIKADEWIAGYVRKSMQDHAKQQAEPSPTPPAA